MEDIIEEKFGEFFLVWESSCRNFIETFTFATEAARLSRLRIHVFLRNDTPDKALPPTDDWIEHHFSLTTCPFASDTSILAYLLERFGDCSEEDVNSGIQTTLFLVTDKPRKFEEAIALLKYKNRQLRVTEVYGNDRSILDVLDSACKYCKLVFSTENELEKHNQARHNYFCHNGNCVRQRKRFYTVEELQKHTRQQTGCPYCADVVFCSRNERLSHLSSVHDITEKLDSPRDGNNHLLCQFCPDKKFTSTEQRDIHMKNCHKKCNCSCGQYFKTRDEYLEHFYSVYPLACFENRKCPHRFQGVLLQAEHHKDTHFSTHPFYCVPCQQRETSETGYRQRICFKDEKSLRIHGMSLGHNEDEMYLEGSKDGSLKTDMPGQWRAPSRTCSAINYC